LADFVRRVWAGTELDPEVGADRVAIEALAALVDVLEVLAGIEDRDVSAVEALQLVLAGLSEVRLTAAVEDPSVDLLGWLELPLDDAPLLVVTGFNEGRVPQIVHGHAFLPDGLRRRLGLADNQHRLARDAYALTAILRSGRDVHLVTGRRNADGDPLRPSRLVFQTGDDELVVQRVRAFLGPDAPGGEARAPGTEEFKCRPLPRGPVDVPDTIAVTAFSTFLTSPYQYYLTRQLRLDTVGDAERELDGRSFGILVHAVLEEFGQDVEARELSDAEAIERDLIGRLHRHVAAVYGRDPLPAVQIQVLQLVRRLAAFARAQAARRHEGWSVAEVEWAPEQPVPFEVDGVPIGLKGRIDRIDVHGERGWAIIDYKTGDKAADPDRQHRSRGIWKDLQLPLYVLLAESYPAEGRPQLGYGVLPCKPDDAGFRFATWTEDELGSAWDVARDVVRRIRAGELFELGKFKSYEPLIDGIAGLGLLGAGEDEGENS
jgi:RecB family exonuclease